MSVYNPPYPPLHKGGMNSEICTHHHSTNIVDEINAP